jgi:rhodanese-related sulfurtransferase
MDTNKDDQIILYCGSGKRAEKAKIILNNLGYMNVINAGSLLEAKILVGDVIEK